MADKEMQSITIRFGSWDLPMTVPRHEEHFYREAERLIKERYTFYTTKYKIQKTEMYLVMTLLDIAVRLQKNQERDDTTPLEEIIQPLINEIESLLEKK